MKHPPCRYVGHEWSRPYFHPVMPPVEACVFAEPVNAGIIKIEVRAEIHCRNCPAWRVIDYDRNVLEDHMQ